MTGRIAPQQPPQQVGQPVGQGGGQEEQLVKLQQIMQSPQFQQLPDQEKLQFIQQGRQILETIKGGGK
jgi:hypothetical protein